MTCRCRSLDAVAARARIAQATHDTVFRSPVAQLVEQAAVNRWVVGSSPTGGASFFSSKSRDRVVYRDAGPELPGVFVCVAGMDVNVSRSL